METKPQSFFKRHASLLFVVMAIAVTTGILFWRQKSAPAPRPPYFELSKELADFPEIIHGKKVTLEN